MVRIKDISVPTNLKDQIEGRIGYIFKTKKDHQNSATYKQNHAIGTNVTTCIVVINKK